MEEWEEEIKELQREEKIKDRNKKVKGGRAVNMGKVKRDRQKKKWGLHKLIK